MGIGNLALSSPSPSSQSLHISVTQLAPSRYSLGGHGLGGQEPQHHRRIRSRHVHKGGSIRATGNSKFVALAVRPSPVQSSRRAVASREYNIIHRVNFFAEDNRAVIPIALLLPVTCPALTRCHCRGGLLILGLHAKRRPRARCACNRSHPQSLQTHR